MYDFAALNFNTNYMTANPFMYGGFPSNMFSNPFASVFNFGGDVASMGMYSSMNYSPSFSPMSMPYFLPFNYLTNWGSTGLPIYPSISNAYNTFPYNYSSWTMPLQMNYAKPKFNFSVPEYNPSSSSFGSYTLPSFTTSRSSSAGSVSRSSAGSHSVSRTSVSGLSGDFVNKVKQIAQRLNCSYDDLLAVMNSESGLNPRAVNSSSGASGLIQFTSVAVQEMNRVYGMNLSLEKIRNMSALEQLDLVEKYFKMTKSRAFSSNARLSAADLYSLCYLPGRATRDVLTHQGENYYDRGLDVNGDGKITKSDLAQRIDRKRVSLVA